MNREEQQARRLKKCKHFNGIQHSACEMGIAYESVRDTSSRPYRWACLPEGTDIPCALREYRTPEELDADDKYVSEMVSNMFLARKAITDVTQGKRDTAGAVDCPVCKTGSVGYTVAYNGHIHAQCTTPNCVSWIE